MRRRKSMTPVLSKARREHECGEADATSAPVACGDPVWWHSGFGDRVRVSWKEPVAVDDGGGEINQLAVADA